VPVRPKPRSSCDVGACRSSTTRAVMPDVHFGIGATVGSVIRPSADHPGRWRDIGCGMWHRTTLMPDRRNR